MSLIIDSHDLSSGQVLSSEIANANNVRFQWKITGATSEKQEVEIEAIVSDDAGVNYEALLDGADRPIKIRLVGNAHASRNIIAINSTSLKFRITPIGTCDGTISINATNS